MDLLWRVNIFQMIFLGLVEEISQNFQFHWLHFISFHFIWFGEPSRKIRLISKHVAEWWCSCMLYLYVGNSYAYFSLIYVGMAAYSKSSQPSPCNWVVEALALRKSVFLVSWNIPMKKSWIAFVWLTDFSGVMWALRDSLLIHKWTWQHGGRWGFVSFVLWVQSNVRIPHC